MKGLFIALVTLSLAPPTAANDRALQCDSDFAAIVSHLEPGAVLLVGEIHGTREIPAAFGDLVCHAAGGDYKVAVGLEMTADQQAPVDAYLQSDGNEKRRQILLATTHWQTHDGRSSKAMLALLERLRQMKQSGAHIDVFTFDTQSESNSQARDKGMAELAADALKRQRDAISLLFAGNIHTLTTASVPWDANYEPMGLHLKKAFPEALSILAVYSGGRAWMCPGETCGEFDLAGKPAHAKRGLFPAPERVHLKADLLLSVGSITPSAPAVQ